jgi:hypothetical protein
VRLYPRTLAGLSSFHILSPLGELVFAHIWGWIQGPEVQN